MKDSPQITKGEESISRQESEPERYLSIENEIANKFSFGGSQKHATFEETSVSSGAQVATVTDIWTEKTAEGQKLGLEVRTEDQSKFVRLDFKSQKEVIESVFQTFGVSSENAADIVGEQAYLSEEEELGVFHNSQSNLYIVSIGAVLLSTLMLLIAMPTIAASYWMGFLTLAISILGFYSVSDILLYLFRTQSNVKEQFVHHSESKVVTLHSA